MEITKSAVEPAKAHIYLDKKYALLKQIGEGGFGGIFLAWNTEDNTYWAVKLNRKEETEEIETEIEMMNYFDHPNVLGLEDYSLKKGVLQQENGETVFKTVSYMVMPYASHGDLGSYLCGDAYFDEDIAVYFFHQIFYGLNHIHDKGYVHLDIKPDNILVAQDYQLLIADFGLSQPLKGEDGKGNFLKRRCGTSAFWSPEISLNFEYNGVQADLYALGIMLFIMVFGCRPFRETKTSDPLFMKLLREPLAFWMAHPVTRNRIKSRTVSEEVVDLLARLLMVNPEQRLSKSDIKKHPWMYKYSKDIYEENDYEDFEFCPEILNEDDDSDYVVNEEDEKSSNCDVESQGIDTDKWSKDEDEEIKSNKSLSDIEVDSNYSGLKDKEGDLLQKCIIPKKSFLEKIGEALTNIKSSRK